MNEIDNLAFVQSLKKVLFWHNLKTDLVSGSYWFLVLALIANIYYLKPALFVIIFYWIWLFVYRMMFVNKMVNLNIDLSKSVIIILDETNKENSLELAYLKQFKSPEQRELIDHCLSQAQKRKNKECKKNIRS